MHPSVNTEEKDSNCQTNRTTKCRKLPRMLLIFAISSMHSMTMSHTISRLYLLRLSRWLSLYAYLDITRAAYDRLELVDEITVSLWHPPSIIGRHDDIPLNRPHQNAFAATHTHYCFSSLCFSLQVLIVFSVCIVWPCRMPYPGSTFHGLLFVSSEYAYQICDVFPV